MKKIITYVCTFSMTLLLLMACDSTVNNINTKEIKKVVDTVLSYEGGYDDVVNKYISEETFYDGNYVIFYSYFLGNTHLTKYESEVKSIVKSGKKYTAFMVINMKAIGDLVEEGNHVEEVQEPEAEGKNVPVEVLLTKKDGNFYIEKIKEYDSLEEAIKIKKEFK